MSEAAPTRRVGRIVEVEALAEFDQLVAGGARRMRGWRMRGVDLRRRTSALLALEPSGALLLGCRVTKRADEHLRRHGAVVFPDLPAVPVDAYRSELYTADELYGGLEHGYPTTLDGRAYAWSQMPGMRPDDAVAQALHDAAVDEALDDLVAGRRVVGVMGGHAAERGTPTYRQAAELGRALARDGALVATGGGPGAMEAVNLGASLAGYPDAVLDEAITTLAEVSSFRPSIERWATVAMGARARWPGDGGLGVPTWAYGHEPPNVFAGAIAKYFQNAVREATLLRRCVGGIAFLPGAAGTVQELFQDACENYYAEPPMVAPMVLVGAEHWTTEVPAWPLLEALASGREMRARIHLAGTVADAATLLRDDE